MIGKKSREWFSKEQWRFVGRLPQKNRNNLLIVTPHVIAKDLKFFFAISEITSIPSKLYLNKVKWYYFIFSRLLSKKNIFKKSLSKEILDKNFKVNRYSNVLFVLKNKKDRQEKDFNFLNYAKKNNISISLITFDKKDKLLKFHSTFYPSIDPERDLEFIQRYFDSHNYKNKFFSK